MSSYQQSQHRQEKGLSLVELLIAAVILAFIIAMAAPAYTQFIHRSSLNSFKDAFAETMQEARRIAAQQGVVTSICLSHNGETCSRNAGAKGWIAFIDNGDNGGQRHDGWLNGTEEVIARFTQSGRLTLGMLDETMLPSHSLSFNPQGFSYREMRRLTTLCIPREHSHLARGVMLERNGRFTETTDSMLNDGIHEARFDNGKGQAILHPLTCENT